jgi:penicillin amidase
MRAYPLRFGRTRSRGRVGHVVNSAVAACVSVVLLGVLGFGYRTVPALGPALDPGEGVWTSAVGGEPVHAETLELTGLIRPVTVTFTSHGVASIDAATDHDLFLALGYVHARFRLTEMDEARRLGGRLAQLAGPAGLASDKFELQLGLLRTAQAEWARMPQASPAAQALLAYARGVSDDIAQVRASGQWPAVFTLAGVYPGPWTPADSLVIQGELAQELDFTTTPLDYALLERSLGAARTMDWFPVIAKDAHTPYDPGPYVRLPLTPIAPDTGGGARTTARSADITPTQAQAAGTLLAQLSQLPAGQLHEYPDSNAWAANGPAVKTKAPCWPGTRTCCRRSRRSGMRSPCPRQTSTSPGSACRACPPSSSATTRASPGPSPTPRTRPPFSTKKRHAATSTTETAPGARCRSCNTRSRCAARRRCRWPWTSPCTARS